MPFPPLSNVQNSEAATLLKGSSWLSYNGLLLTDVLTEAYEMQEERTPDQAQVLGVKYTIKVTGIINPGVNTYFRSPGNPEVPAVRQDIPVADLMGNINIIRDQMMQDRKILKWGMGGTLVLESPVFDPANTNVRFPCDSAQGPKPLYCQVTKIIGTGCFYVRFGIETTLTNCYQALRYIKAHRFSMAHDVDGDTWLTTRMVQGQVTFHPEWLNLARTLAFPDKIEHIWAHPVPDGFKRSNVKVQAHPSGMEVAYSFVDTEQHLPTGTLSPATKFSAEFSLSSSLAADKPALTQAAFHAQAIGPKNQYRFNLLIMAIRLANRKLQKPGHMMTTDIVITYSLDQCMVDLTMKALWKPVGIGADAIQLNMTGLTAAEDLEDLDIALQAFRNVGEGRQGTQSNSAQTPHMRNHDTMGTFSGYVVGSNIVDGCLNLTRPVNEFWSGGISGKTVDDSESGAGGGGDFGSLLDNAGNAISFNLNVTPTLTITPLSTGLSAEAVNGYGLYEEWRMTTRYHTNHQKAMMPVGASQTASPGDVTTYRAPQFATLGLPYTLKAVDWTIAWIGPSPAGIILPSPDTGDTNDVLLAEDVSPAVPGIANSTNKTWRISGTYWYGQKKLRTASLAAKTQFDYVDQGFAMGRSITDPSVQAANTVGLTKFVAGYSPSFV